LSKNTNSTGILCYSCKRQQIYLLASSVNRWYHRYQQRRAIRRGKLKEMGGERNLRLFSSPLAEKRLRSKKSRVPERRAAQLQGERPEPEEKRVHLKKSRSAPRKTAPLQEERLRTKKSA
jgi:hypothetical protein